MSSSPGLPMYGIAACLTVCGSDLDPSMITQLLNVSPKVSHRRGDTILTPYERKEVLAEEGTWIHEGPMFEQPLEIAVDNLFKQMPTDQCIWDRIAKENNIELTCLFFLDSYKLLDSSLSSRSLCFLSERHISLSLKGITSPKPVDE